jgi:hypothetical protein
MKHGTNVIHVVFMFLFSVYISKKYIWRIGNDADNYIDTRHNLCAILKLIYPLKVQKNNNNKNKTLLHILCIYLTFI